MRQKQILKKATGIDLANLKSEVDKWDIGKLETTPVDLSKPSDVVENDVVKNTEYNKLVTKVNATDTSGFVAKTHFNTDKSGREKKIKDADKKIRDTCGLVKKTDYNAKITEIEGKIPSITGLATTSARNAV